MKTVFYQRAFENERVTLGMLKVEGVRHDPFYILENPQRKTSYDSRIPAGDYLVSPYSGTKFKDVFWVHDVPGRDAILIHQGNWETDSAGCLLIGNQSGLLNGKPAVGESRAALERFRKCVRNEAFNIFIFDVGQSSF